jgi:hypothetical protein
LLLQRLKKAQAPESQLFLPRHLPRPDKFARVEARMSVPPKNLAGRTGLLAAMTQQIAPQLDLLLTRLKQNQ